MRGWWGGSMRRKRGRVRRGRKVRRWKGRRRRKWRKS